ncbi:hypothetical protein F5Y02DRAFT_226832 [Annulohypoxylon stygium]|nr:hypothetical protein F5Y02DRAFT_226832 [Annulohypoxylon stygium]
MCFTEFLGYTCGHTSVPVKRPCPMTTQSHVNPVCPSPACRPLLALTMCPSCARIVHGRWIDIVVHEHQFMHARGVCHCPVRFPPHQQPRVLSQHADYDNDVEGMAREAFAAHFRNQSMGQESNDSGSSSRTIVPARKDKQQAPSPAQQPFNFSPWAAEFTPSNASAHPFVSPTPPNQLYDIPAEFDYGMGSQYLQPINFNQFSPASDVEPHGYNTPNSGNNDAQGSSNKGKGKEVATGQEPLESDYFTGHHHGDAFHGEPYPRSGSAASSATMATSSTIQNLPPMITSTEGPDNRPGFETRMISQYGAEWLAEHAQRHESGDCDCRCSFQKYHGQYMHMLAEEGTPDNANEEMHDDFADFSFSYEFADQQDEPGATPFGVDVSQRFDNLPYGTPGFHSDGYVLAPSNTPAEAAGHPYAHLAGDFGEQLSRAMDHHFNPALPTVPPVPSSPYPAMPAPIINPYDADAWRWNELSLDTHAYGEPARWACAPPEGSHSNDNVGGGAMQTPRPVDMHVIAYDVDQVPIAGLPIGAGPEGDSHMPPFEDCELFYPKLRDNQRGASF